MKRSGSILDAARHHVPFQMAGSDKEEGGPPS